MRAAEEEVYGRDINIEGEGKSAARERLRYSMLNVVKMSISLYVEYKNICTLQVFKYSALIEFKRQET